MLAVLTLIAGVVLILASLSGARTGTSKERRGMAVVGVGSSLYAIWAMHQTSGVIFFSVVPMVMAVAAAVRFARSVAVAESAKK